MFQATLCSSSGG